MQLLHVPRIIADFGRRAFVEAWKLRFRCYRTYKFLAYLRLAFTRFRCHLYLVEHGLLRLHGQKRVNYPCGSYRFVLVLECNTKRSLLRKLFVPYNRRVLHPKVSDVHCSSSVLSVFCLVFNKESVKLVFFGSMVFSAVRRSHWLCSLRPATTLCLKDEKLIRKQTYTKTEAYKLYSRVFWIFLPNIIKIDSYNFELYRFKVDADFWDTV